ncbi:MAG: hemolysin [Candidatus Kerfeldbacteria bacterium CG15_BIG_FIL_POST_REV_8_21_14_020_45_12]|uniref:Hemolysin n=1 Tax=Candidatus Kerfeldbacteria bacterium CG15_BIG_FIL_POST_REV_8_21_14_020_45_12 TaxID=2014247 RepID=A0A2M7H2U4_9BACT|nr:MAG: hemolysin [Candidatus Kerfeldbacteria bacterium CG15_BIG_FIL_POST_REV_8_21_14_020_45_12]PJA93256.1 MAG: hemolysin [Candidatus Kerfeldbacteria bacterium CG_4_9_14_3_um_filter_45_8]
MDQASIYILIILILLSGFFSGAEIALFSLSSAKVRALVARKSRNAKLLQRVKARPQRLLITILIGNNLVNISASSLATVVAIDKFGNAGVGVATGVMTFLILFLGEITPKSIAQKYAEQLSLRVAPIMRFLMLALSPLVWVMYILTRGVQVITKTDKLTSSVSEEEVRAMVDIGHEEGSLEHGEKEMIQNVFLLNDIAAEDVMTPDEYMVYFNTDTLLREAIAVIEESGFSRFPVRSATGDEVVGVLYIKDVFALLAKQAHAGATDEVYDTPISQLIKSPFFVPETMHVDDLMKEFQKVRKHIAIVVDEHGKTRGLVTLEDLLEEIVGEIVDETDIDDKMIRRINKHTIMIDPRIAIGKVNTFFNSELKGPTHKTIGWLTIKHFGRIPQKGDAVTINGYNFTVEEADERRVKRLLMIKTAEARALEHAK